MHEPVDVRASDAERLGTVERLREGAGDGRLTLEELAERIELAHSASTRGELEAIVADLPAGAPAAGREPVRPARRSVVSVLGSSEVGGRWRLAGETRAVSVLGSIELDLREAELETAAPEIRAFSVLGSVEITVPEGVEVEVRGFSLLGSHEARDIPPAPPGAPRLVVRALSLLGSVEVRRSASGRRRRAPLPPPPPPPPPRLP